MRSRAQIRAEVARFAREGVGAFHLFGPAGIGKSRVVSDALVDVPPANVVRVSALTAVGPANFWWSIAVALGAHAARGVDPDEAWFVAVNAAERRARRTLIVAEDLDRLRSHAGGGAALNRLVGLAESGPRNGVAVICISRRRLEVLLANGEHASTAPGCVLTTCVGPWLPDEFLAYAAATRPDIERPALRRLWAWGAGVPKLAVELMGRGRPPVAASDRFAPASKHHAWFENLERYLSEDGSFATLLRCVHGPRVPEAPSVLSRLLQMGMLTARRQPFCLALFEHLEHAHHRGDAFDTWAKTERDLRAVVSKVYERNLGRDWVTQLLADPATSGLILGCEARRSREERVFGGALDHLAYGYPADLWELIQRRWEWFSHLFAEGRDRRHAKQRWTLLFQDLASIRTPIAHTRTEVVPEAKLNVALAICNDLRRVLAPELA